MKRKTLATLILITLVGSITLMIGLAGRRSAAAQTAGIVLPNATIYALNGDNVIFSMAPGTSSFTRLVRAKGVDGCLIGVDFRPSDGSLYALSDTGKLYTIDLTAGAATLGNATLASTLTTRFSGGFQSFADFNPVVDALRLIGSNDQNLAVVNSSGNLNVTAAQTAVAYATGDVNAGIDPNLSGGSYTNNYPGAPNTLLYAIDFNLDTLVTISTRSAAGSSNTGGGQLQTLGQVFDATGAAINFSPIADLDIYTDANGINHLIGLSSRTLFSIDINPFNQQQPTLGTSQKLFANTVRLGEVGGGFIDIAIATTGAKPAPAPAPAPAPTPTPTPTPTPAGPTLIEAERALLGGGARVATNQLGFTGAGFVDYADNVSNSFVEFSLTQTGSRTLTFRYANASAVNRNCAVTVNGAPVGMLTFPPTGAWTTYRTISIVVNLGTAASNKAVRVTSTTLNGGPNLDNLVVQ